MHSSIESLVLPLHTMERVYSLCSSLLEQTAHQYQIYTKTGLPLHSQTSFIDFLCDPFILFIVLYSVELFYTHTVKHFE